MKMQKTNPPKLYDKYFIQKGIERTDLFKTINSRFKIDEALYPGSFVHISPSFVFPQVVYVDSDKRCKSFFQDSNVREYIREKKAYLKESTVRFHERDFSRPFNEEDESFDLLISQFSGFISKYCKRYLKHNGILLVNDSHGDATLAQLDIDYELIAGIDYIDGSYKIIESNLEELFQRKGKRRIFEEEVLKKVKGLKYKLERENYLFARR